MPSLLPAQMGNPGPRVRYSCKVMWLVIDVGTGFTILFLGLRNLDSNVTVAAREDI